MTTGALHGFLRCTAPLWLAVLAAGCATPTVRRVAVPAAPTPAAPLVTPTLSAPLPPPVATPPDFWTELRADFAFARCDDSPQVATWIDRLSAHPQRVHDNLDAVLPRLHYVAQRLKAADIPAEFALLPWVESNYRPVAGKHGGPAGLWQIMPTTGRHLGLRIDQRHDGRLDLHASTQAVITLLNRYDAALGDWRLATMAYNSGLYGVQRLAAAKPGATSSDTAVPDIGASAGVREHLAKLTAMACIVKEPARYGITLPKLDWTRTLDDVALAAPMPPAVAAKIAGVAPEALRVDNLGNTDAGAPLHHLILPRAAATRFRHQYARLMAQHWMQWQQVELRTGTQLADLTASTEARHLLRDINDVSSDATLSRGTRLWLPVSLAATLPSEVALAATVDTTSTHRVTAGESLWHLARRFHVRVADLKAWNGIKGNHLRLGQVLRVAPRDVGSVVASDALN